MSVGDINSLQQMLPIRPLAYKGCGTCIRLIKEASPDVQTQSPQK